MLREKGKGEKEGELWPRAATMETLPIVDKASKVGPEKAESTSLSRKSQTASGFKRYPGEAFLFGTRTRTLPTDNDR